MLVFNKSNVNLWKRKRLENRDVKSKMNLNFFTLLRIVFSLKKYSPRILNLY